MTGSSQRRRSSTTTSRNENHRPRQTQQEQSRDGERVWKVRGRPCFKRNARLTHLPSKLSCQGSTSSRAPCRSSRHSPRLRSSPSSSSLVVSRSQGRSQEASLAPRPTSCSPTPSPPSRCPSARSPICQGLPHSRLDSFEKVVFFLVCVFFGCRCCGFFYCATAHQSGHCTDRVLGWNIWPGGKRSWKFRNRNFHLGSTRGDSSITSQRKKITNIARDGEVVRGVPRGVALRRRRV